jgi:hypothetical protein
LIYQLHDGILQSIDGVYDKGAALTAGLPYTSAADMQSNPPAVGEYRVYLATGFFRLGSAPVGVVTAHATQGLTAANRTTAQVLKSLFYPANSLYDATSFAALDTANSGTVGIYISEEMQLTEAIEAVANSIGAWCGFDSTKTIYVGRLVEPSGSPSLILTSAEILTLDRLATQDEGRGVPSWKVTVNYAKNNTVQDASSLAGNLPPITNFNRSKEYLTVSATDATIKTIHLNASEITFNTLLTSASAAQAEADRQLALRKVRRDYLKVTVKRSILFYVPKLGHTVKITYPRYGYDDGKLFTIIGMEVLLATDDLLLQLWG